MYNLSGDFKMILDLSSAIMKVPVVSPDERVSKAISLMASSPTRGVVVFEQGDGVLGVVDDRTLRDFRLDASIAKVGTVVEHTAILSPSSTPEQAIAFFLNSHARIAPVFDGKNVVGA